MRRHLGPTESQRKLQHSIENFCIQMIQGRQLVFYNHHEKKRNNVQSSDY